MSLPRKAQRLIAVLERIAAPGSGASPVEVALAQKERARLLEEQPSSTPRRLVADSAQEAPLRLLTPCGVVDPGAGWALALAASVAEACGAKLVVSPMAGALALGFAGAGDDPETAAASWAVLHPLTEGRSPRWCAGFAAAIDERLDATIDAMAPRVERVAAWLGADPLTTEATMAPLLDVEGDEEDEGAGAAWEVML